MRFLNHAGRMTIDAGEGRGIDVERASGGRLPASPAEAIDRWSELRAWADGHPGDADVEIDQALIGPPSPAPRQILGVGLNYESHAHEAGFEIPEQPMIFAKLHASLAGPFDAIPISTAAVDWEVELVVIMGRRTRHVPAAKAWDHVAGLTIGQDLSEREIQFRPAKTPQFGLGKSLPGFGPIGPALVTPDELDDRDDLELICAVNGEEVQRGRTSDFIFSIPQLVEYLSATTVLYPGDLIMTGTPSGVGFSRTPPRYLQPGDVLESRIPQLGAMRHELVLDPEAALAQTAR
jgi:2,4-diketo-3-deoxy-L-fuconate hydrolase